MGATYSHGVWEQFTDQASTIFGQNSLLGGCPNSARLWHCIFEFTQSLKFLKSLEQVPQVPRASPSSPLSKKSHALLSSCRLIARNANIHAEYHTAIVTGYYTTTAITSGKTATTTTCITTTMATIWAIIAIMDCATDHHRALACNCETAGSNQ